ncbi:urease accessory protein UreF [Kitasatospora sp. NBC_01287]|uniref:urease accessory protein UreF n=1 Tax=Kitasatospora sp. NBC_01287 TaxID=2903573 RepID=UPI002252E4C1|nr:urease accessory UreF family protein [Kitasatospora sp. NBC_01287]MCX4751491.1 urease accessory protein UreF [Kitasatospora sp. NBC_01287]
MAVPPEGLARTATLLLLADGRFPAGGHAHSGGVEAAVTAGAVHDIATLERFLTGRLHTAGLTAAGLAAAAAGGFDPAELDAAAEARTPSPALRAAGRRLGRQLLRAARACWPDDPGPAVDSDLAPGPDRAAVGATQHSVVLGLVARAAGLTPDQAAVAAAHESVNGPATAAVRLLGLDPYQVVAVLARLTPAVDAVAATAAEAAALALQAGDVDLLPCASAPLLDLYAERHDSWKVKLFAS